MITLSDVAKKANVSKMTVSRVINHPEQVTDELRELVEDAMEELDYRPNSAAKALAYNRTNVVKVVILEDVGITEPYYMSLLFGIAKGLDKQQYALQLVTEREDLKLGDPDGYIITGARNTDSELLASLQAPVVVFGENRSGFDFIDTDNKEGIKMATEFAIAKNYQSIIFIGIDVKEPFEYSREAGYINTMQQHQMIPRIHRMANHSHLSQKFINEHWREFARNTIFICASDRLAVGVVRAILHNGGNIPVDFGVIGFDGVFLDQVSNPQLSTIRQPVQRLGEHIARMLLQKIAQSGAQQGELMLTPELILRGTTRD
ncbi:LacI family DNA-binding transcriptional regulator [Lacticaseibacillus pabuli]|uniref:LacI family DNA-binding transcriptional regulator n=1 Tax=Lacticaseibacillus pabuli TaxID=3025672 RepID=A0ABY7WRD8_9LACO|nr:LacI family DNA-binding transcriptional regulator [Lacticaseibacillus sp. KACC 23028]WDF82271.1 LacI family DNA-binding transcriptional regulator [Lacticaseibacillus sp. KACC 23028]